MKFSWRMSDVFADEFDRFPTDLQDHIFDFTDLYEVHGLGDFSKFPGKCTPSWAGLLASDPNYAYTRDNELWHYHIGLPSYRRVHQQYMTSDWVLHFRWPGRGKHIDLVDTCTHRKANGEFHLPAYEYLRASTIEPLHAVETAEIASDSQS